ncbi:hypothetical protein BSKO_01475 [Bryopsis sp. KO-2023]|nr:hypothetical protein BSKO_01475 [Bryopsis sp. KO-2023]
MFRWVARRTSEFIENVKNPLQIASERTLYNFQSEENLKQWNVFSDHEYGGSSVAALKYGEGDPNFAIFCGECSTDVPGANSSLKQSGFCGVHAKDGEVMDLSDFDHIRFKVRGPRSQNFIANLHMDSWIVGGESFDLWQAALPCRSEEWHDVDIPFHEFLLTWKGRLVQHRVEMNMSRVKGVGVSFAGRLLPGGAGRFSLDIASISAQRLM